MTCFANGNLVSQAEVDFVVRYGRHDVLVFARIGNGFAQVDFVCIAFIRCNVQTFVQLFTNLVQCVLNGMHRCTCRTVGMIDGKVRLYNLSSSRINAGIQRFGYRIQLADVNRIGLFCTFGNLGNLVAAVIQT